MAIVVVLTILATATIAAADLVRADFVVANADAVEVPPTWLLPLGLVKVAGAAGLLLGLLGVPLVGEAAALGLIVFFVGALITHLRAGNHELAFPLGYLALSVASLVVLATS